ncbi:YceH family protein [Rubrivirga sp. IMCC45206]|uniref:YceH family protein n=1 Tax=Rubrivirga sp. IMCC45206 TaxID=3391614 RepID=UPI00398FD9D6
MSRPTLDAIEARVAGALAEKALATPDHYPLTTNALVAACNQKSSREPVTDYSEREVKDAAERLMRRGLAGTTAGAGHRVAKFRHTLDRSLDLSKRELAALCVLLLRGPQTPGEIRTRTARLADFASVSDAEEALWMLGDRDDPLVVKLPREPGQAADRYAHTLSGDVEPAPLAEDRNDDEHTVPVAGGPTLAERVAELEAEVEGLRAEMEAFRAQFE